MRFVGFIGPSYQLSSVNVDCQRCIGLYPELDELGTGKEREIASLRGTPGKRLLATIGTGPIRGSFAASNGQFFVVSYNKLYKVSSTWVPTEIGTLTTTSGPVSMSDSGKRLAVVDGSVNGYFWKFETSTLSAIPFPTEIDFVPFAGADQVVFLDGYFIFNHKGTGQFFRTGQVNSIVADDSTIDPLDFDTAEGSPDPLNGIIVVQRTLWLFGTLTAEPWFDAGDVDRPFQRVQGAYVEKGSAAMFGMAEMDNTVFWLGQDKKGNGIVYMANGYQPVRISTHAVEQAIQSYGDLSGTTGYTYQDGGHNFYVLNFTTANTTWVYDSNTKLWHERVYTNAGHFERDRADNHAFAFSTHVVGDYQNGNIYELSSNVFTDNGNAITRRRVSPHISDSLKRLFYSSFQLDIESGTGIDGLGQGVDPQAMLEWSNDGGHTWSNENWKGLGKIGQTRWRAVWTRLGLARDRVFRVTITDPVKVVLIGAELEFEKGAT